MRATRDILEVWRKFDDFPMETITKAWYNRMAADRKQRTVELMKMHREKYGTSGNCFDLAIWLIDEFRAHGLNCHAIFTPRLHVAVVVMNSEGNKYLCDLGDQWIEPILIEREHEDYTEEFLDGFFPGSRIKLNMQPDLLHVTYRRPNGKESKQRFYLKPIPDHELIAAGERTQRKLRTPLVEKRLFLDDQVAHWEFDNFQSFTSYQTEREEEEQLASLEEWADRIHAVSGIHQEVVLKSLEVYTKLSADK